MAIKDKSKTTLPPIIDELTANPIAARTAPVTPKQASAARTADPQTQRFLNGLVAPVPRADESPSDADLGNIRAFFFFNNQESLMAPAPAEREPQVEEDPSAPPLDLKNPIDAAYSQFRKANPEDRATTASYERYVSSLPPTSSYYRPDFTVRQDGFKPPAFTLPPSVAREQLAKDISTVSTMYAADAGISARDMASVLGGIATIESRFGVARSVTGTKYPSSAGGAFHFLDATVAGRVKQSLSDPRIAERAQALGITFQNGVSKSEAWTLKDDNILAGSLVAKEVVKTLKAHPELRNDIAALTTRVYQSHNMGDAGAAALARGGVDALNALDPRIAANNPMFFRSGDAQKNYASFVGNAVHAADKLFDSLSIPTTVAAAGPRTPQPS